MNLVNFALNLLLKKYGKFSFRQLNFYFGFVAENRPPIQSISNVFFKLSEFLIFRSVSRLVNLHSVYDDIDMVLYYSLQ